MAKTKICKTCKEKKNREDFYKDKRRKDGLAGECKECCIERAIRNRNKRFKSNPEYREKYLREQSEATNERRKWKRRHDKEWRKKDIEYKRQYYRENKETINQKWREYYLENKEDLIHRNRIRYYNNRETVHTMTEEQWEKCKDYFNNKCAYCGEDTKELTRDHVLAYSKGGYNVQSNIVPACQSCNSSKRDKDMEEWYRTKNYFDNKRLEKIYNWTNIDEDMQQMALF